MRLLVTGASGFLGRRLCTLLRERHDIVGLYASERPDISGVRWVRHRHTPGTSAAHLPDDVEGIVHLAQSARYREFPEGAADMYAVNVDFLFQLLEHARRCGARAFVNTSTGGVYDAAGGALREDAGVRPRGFYPASKLAAEALCAPYESLFAVTSLRLFFIYGAGQAGRLIPNLAARIRDGQPIDLAGRAGGLCLTPTHADDVVAVIEAALAQAWQGTCNVAAPEVLSIEDIARALGGALGIAPAFQRDGREEPEPLVPDLSLLRERFDIGRFRKFADCVETLV